MKKVKIMLMAILVVAVVGGALAFKVKKDEFCIYTTPTTDPGNICLGVHFTVDPVHGEPAKTRIIDCVIGETTECEGVTSVLPEE